MPSDPFGALGEFLTAREANALAVQFESGQPTARALTTINSTRRAAAKQLLAAAGISHLDSDVAAAVLRSIAGAKSVNRDLTPVWTMPGNEATTGHLTSEFHRIVSAARQSIVCATYNFERTSHMWTALEESSEHLGVVVTVYIDSDKADVTAVKARLPKATVYRSAELPTGRRVVSHAKFIIIDHEVLLLTSANFSHSAENRNIEFGLLVRDSALAEDIETTMTSKHGTLYELVANASACPRRGSDSVCTQRRPS